MPPDGTRLADYGQLGRIDGEEYRPTRQGGVRTVYWAPLDIMLTAVARRAHDAAGAGGPKSVMVNRS